MARTLQERLDYLCSGKSTKEVGQRLMKAQLALDRMSSDPPPNYEDEWLAPLYLAWYGPSHINMAYTLFTQVISQQDDTLSKGPLGVHLEDYACGPFTGQFAFALAASEASEQFSETRLPSIYSDDSSDPMWSLGKNVWDTTLDVLGFPWDVQTPYSYLGSFRDAARRLKFRRRNNYSAPVWLTAFHGAYPGDVGQVLREKMDVLVQRNKPTVVLTTSHRTRGENMYAPPLDTYEGLHRASKGPSLAITGWLPQVTAWRRRIAGELLADVGGFEPWEHERVNYLLSEFASSWSPPRFEYVFSLYVRKDS